MRSRKCSNKFHICASDESRRKSFSCSTRTLTAATTISYLKKTRMYHREEEKKIFSDGSPTSCSLVCFSHLLFALVLSFFSIIHFILFSSYFSWATWTTTNDERARRTIFLLSSSWFEPVCVDISYVKSEAQLVIVCFEVNVHQCERVFCSGGEKKRRREKRKISKRS